MRFLQLQASPRTIAKLGYRSVQQWLGKNYPFFVSYEITQHCNIRCDGCFYYEEVHAHHDGSADPQTAQSVKILQGLADAGVPVVQLIGGEPFMREDLPEIVAAGDAMGLTLTVVTNGMKLDRRKLEAVDRHCEWVIFSPHVPEEIKGKRGEKHYESAWQGLEIMRAAISRSVLVSTIVISKHTAPRINELIERSIAAGVDKIKFNPNIYHRLFITQDEASEVVSAIRFWKKRFPKVIIESEEALDNLRKAFSNNLLFDCYINRHFYMNVSVKGDVSACPATNAPLGNIIRTPLLEMIEQRVPEISGCNGCTRLDVQTALRLTGARH